MGLPTTWGSITNDLRPITNDEVRARAGQPTLTGRVCEQQILALGHLFRAGARSPQGEVTFGRYLRPGYLHGDRRR
eukprot:11085649-Alexandrium_andersonii.AAC.1